MVRVQRSGAMHVGIDGTTWRNERGFGRFTRELVAALAVRDAGFRYTLVLDQDPAYPVPAGVETVVAGNIGTPARLEAARESWVNEERP